MTATAPESGPDAGGRCPHCGESVDAGASFCEACGKPLDAAGGVDGPSAPADAAREEGPMDDLGSGPISASVQLPRTVELPPPEMVPFQWPAPISTLAKGRNFPTEKDTRGPNIAVSVLES